MRRIIAVRALRTIAIAGIFFLMFCSRFIGLFMATEEGRGYLEIILQEPLRAFLIAAVEIGGNLALIVTFLQFGVYSLIAGFIIDSLLNWPIKKTDVRS